MESASESDFRRYMGLLPNGTEPEILNATVNVAWNGVKRELHSVLQIMRLGAFWWPSTRSDGSEAGSATA